MLAILAMLHFYSPNVVIIVDGDTPYCSSQGSICNLTIPPNPINKPVICPGK